MKFIEIYTLINGDIKAVIYKTKGEALYSHDCTKYMENEYKESAVISLNQKGETERIAYWKRA